MSAPDVWPFGFPGFQGLKLDAGSAPHMGYTAAGYAMESRRRVTLNARSALSESSSVVGDGLNRGERLALARPAHLP